MKTIQFWRLKTVIANEANSSEHFMVKSNRHKKQKKDIKKAFLADRPTLQLPFHIVLTRIAPRELDAHDNLPLSMKWIVDSIADYFFPGKKAGRADDTKEITWEYKQEKGQPKEYGLRIEMIKDETITKTL